MFFNIQKKNTFEKINFFVVDLYVVIVELGLFVKILQLNLFLI